MESSKHISSTSANVHTHPGIGTGRILSNNLTDVTLLQTISGFQLQTARLPVHYLSRKERVVLFTNRYAGILPSLAHQSLSRDKHISTWTRISFRSTDSVNVVLFSHTLVFPIFYQTVLLHHLTI